MLSHRWPDVPNLGDISQVDWALVEGVDIFAGGSPCQDVSNAGLGKGMVDGTRSNLFVEMCKAIEILQPEFVLWENVRGVLSAKAYSTVEREEGLLGDAPSGSLLRAAGRVHGSLASLGYRTEQVLVSAADVGAPHLRKRVFVLGIREDCRP